MLVYAESSAVLSWLLAEQMSRDVVQTLSRAELVLSSRLTEAECGRAFSRLESQDVLRPEDASRRRAALNRALGFWSLVRMDTRVWQRAARPFPVEPVRTLDALHLALALEASEQVGPVTMLSLDQRVRRNALAMGLDVAPA